MCADRQRDNIALAISAVVVSVLALSLGDAVIKSFSVSFPLWQMYVLRSLLALPVLVVIAKLRGSSGSFLPLSIKWTACRSLLLAIMWVAYYAALPNIQLSVAAAAYYTSPLFITLFAGMFTEEKVGSKGWFAIILGFAGALVILRPDAEEFSAYGLLPIVAAILYATAMILTRTKCSRENPMALSLALNVTFVILGAVATLFIQISGLSTSVVSADPFLFGSWVSLGSADWLALSVLAGAIVVGSIGAAIAYQAAPSSIVAPFDFFYLAFASLWGFLVFAEVPNFATVIGMAMIAAAGLIAVKR